MNNQITAEDAKHMMLDHQTGGLPTDRALILAKDGQPCVVAFFSDLDWDVFAVEFGSDGEITFMTENFSYLELSANCLSRISDASFEADEKWAEIDEFWDDEEEDWLGWSHLIDCPEI